MTSRSSARITHVIGDAHDLSSFFQLVDGWIGTTTDLGYNINLFRGQENEAWRLTPGIPRAPRVKPGTGADMLAEFRHRAIPYLESTLDLADADWLAIAQHHAMPTRLLDWSGSALAALWFAIKRPAGPGKDEARVAAAVWMLPCDTTDLISDKERHAPLTIAHTKILKPRHVSRRIVAQDGWFSVHRGVADGLDMKFVPLDTNAQYKKRLGYVRIPGDALGIVSSQLAIAGISRAVLFPDLDGVAGALTARYLYPDDQLPPLRTGLGNRLA